MDIEIKSCLQELHSSKPRRFKFSYEGMFLFSQLSPSSRDLLYELLHKVKRDSIVINVNYTNFGYKHKQQFYRDRNELVKQGLLFYKGSNHLINPYHIDYLTKSMKEELYEKYGLSKKIIPNLGSR